MRYANKPIVHLKNASNYNNLKVLNLQKPEDIEFYGLTNEEAKTSQNPSKDIITFENGLIPDLNIHASTPEIGYMFPADTAKVNALLRSEEIKSMMPVDMTFAWDYYTQLKNVFQGQPAFTINATSANEYTNVPNGKHKLRFTTNHDQSAWEATPVTLFGGVEASFAAQAAAVLMGGVPLIYSGQEVGVAGTQSFFTKDPVNWAANPGLQERYGQLFALRLEHDALRYGTLKPYSHPNVLAFERELDGERVLVLINTRSTAITYNLPTALRDSDWTDVLRAEPKFLGTALTLAGHEVVVLAN